MTPDPAAAGDDPAVAAADPAAAAPQPAAAVDPASAEAEPAVAGSVEAVVVAVAPAPSPGYAGAVTRLAAYVVDLTVMSALFSAGGAVVAYLVAVITGDRLDLSGDRDLAGVGLVVWWFAYFAGSWAVTGRTPGMALLGLRVAGADGGGRASIVSSFMRALTFPLSVVLFGLGFLGILFDRRRRALHDVLAGTTVVYADGPVAAVGRGTAAGSG